MAFINFSELYNAGGSFARQEVIEDGGTTTIYGGYAPSAEPTDDTDNRQGWKIRKLVVIDGGSRQDITCMWATGTWAGRYDLVYKYYLN